MINSLYLPYDFIKMKIWRSHWKEVYKIYLCCDVIYIIQSFMLMEILFFIRAVVVWLLFWTVSKNGMCHQPTKRYLVCVFDPCTPFGFHNPLSFQNLQVFVSLFSFIPSKSRIWRHDHPNTSQQNISFGCGWTKHELCIIGHWNFHQQS